MSMLYNLQNVSKTRRIGNVEFELHIPEFQMRPGEFVAIVGPSGCGKSTLLDLLALVLRPNETADGLFQFDPSLQGVEFADICSFWRSRQENRLAEIRRRHIGYVLQTGGLLPFFSVRQNIGLTCRLNGYRGAMNERIEELALKLEIKNQLDKKPQFLSGGQRQRVAIARAMAHSPSVVLADEPTAAVDSDRAKHIVKIFRQLAEDAKTGIIMVTHDRNLIEAIADRKITFELPPCSSENGVEKTRSILTEIGDPRDVI